MKLKYAIPAFCLLVPLTTQAATVVTNLNGLQNPTGAATNGGDTRQYEWTTSGGEVTFTYTLDINMDPLIDLNNDFQFDTLFRRAGSGAQLPATGGNMVAGENLTITLDSIVANSGWTLNSVTKTNTLVVGGDGRNGSENVTFSVNGGTTFDLNGLGTSGTTTLTDARFTAFDAAGDTLSLTTTAGNAGKLNFRNIAFSLDVTATPIPEPSSTALVGLGGLALILRRRR
jgi:hypothetical protein